LTRDFCFNVGLSSSESLLLLDETAFFVLFARLIDWTVGLLTATDFLFAETAWSSSESLLLDEAAFLTGTWADLAAGVDLTGTADGFLFLLSSDESLSDEDEEACFFLLLLFDWTVGFVIDELAGVVGAEN